jgi:hypothetical protein
MNLNWPLAVVIIAVLFFGYCAYSTRQATRSIDRALDETWTQQRCYALGYQAAALDKQLAPADDSEQCARWFSVGFSDGRIAYNALDGVAD